MPAKRNFLFRVETNIYEIGKYDLSFQMEFSLTLSDKGTKKYLTGEHYCCAGPMKAALPLSFTGELSHD